MDKVGLNPGATRRARAAIKSGTAVASSIADPAGAPRTPHADGAELNGPRPTEGRRHSDGQAPRLILEAADPHATVAASWPRFLSVTVRGLRTCWSFRWTIGRKVAGLGGVGLLVALIIGGVSFVNVAKIKEASDLRAVLAAAEAELTKLDKLASDVQVYERDMLMAADDSSRREAIDNLNETHKATVRHWTRLESLRLPADLRESLVEIRKEYDGHVRVIIEMMPILGSLGVTSPDVAVALLREQARAQAVRTQLRPVRARMAASDEAARQVTDKRIADVKRTVLVAGLVGMGALLLAGLLITRSITRRLHALRLRMHEIADGDGDLAARLDETARDETGDVARAANRFFGRVQELVAQLSRAEDELRTLAFQDNLTGLANRALFVSSLDDALAAAQRHDRGLAVMFVDLDDFKPVNDRFGHEAGDAVLREVGERLRACVRTTDVVARIGGDEFAILFDNCAVDAIEIVGKRIVELVTKPCWAAGQWAQIGASIGVALSRGEHDGAQLMRNADAAMYTSKSLGKGRCEFFSDTGLDLAEI